MISKWFRIVLISIWIASTFLAIGHSSQEGSKGSTVASDLESARKAVHLLDRALDAMGRPEVLSRFGYFAIHAAGTLDKTAEGQGFTPERPSPGKYRETIAIDTGTGSVAWEYREDRYDGTFEWFRESYPSDQNRLYVVHEHSLVIPARASTFAGDRQRLLRRIPHLALAELFQRTPNLRYLGKRNGVEIVRGTLPDGTLVSVELNAGSFFLQRYSYISHLPAKGDVEVAWWYNDYRPVEGLGMLPHLYGSTVGGVPYTEMVVKEVSRDAKVWFQHPEGYRVLPERTVDRLSQKDPGELSLEPIAEGVFVVSEVRSGFAPMVIELDHFLVAVDAPASFPLLGQIPAGETDPGPNISWASERFVDAIREAFPKKPIRYIVLTHAHEDHFGGIRAFIAAGATVLASSTSRAAVERLINLPADMVRDRYSAGGPQRLSFEAVDQPRAIEGGSRVDILPIQDNPHYDGLLAIHLPEQRILYLSDLVTPEKLDVYPMENHAALDMFFGQWLAKQNLAIDSVYAMHGSGALTAEHLEKLR